MAPRNSYGERLRQARLRRGMDLPSVARRLRIRQDILCAIEDGAFAALPPSGYTRNMITAYARLVGLDPRTVADAYLDELHRFETGRERERSAGRAPQRRGREASTRPLPSRPMRDSAPAPRPGYDAQGRRGERVSYNAYAELNPYRAPEPEPASGRRGGAMGSRGLYGGSSASGRRRDQAPSRTIGQYSPSTYGSVGASRSGGLLAALLPRLPFILGGALVIALVVAVIVLAFGSARQESAEVPSVPISGLTDTSSQSQEDFNVATAVAPTSAVLELSVEEDGRSWVSVYVDGSEDAELNETVEGPMERSFTFTKSIRVVAGNPTPVKLKVDGKPADLSKGSSGSYVYAVQFSEILAQWEEEHPSKSSSRSASSSSSAASSASSSSSSSSSSSGASRSSSASASA